MSGEPAILAALRKAIDFRAVGDRAGNASMGAGTLDGRKVHVLLVENKLASGSIGTHEAKKIVAMLTIAAKEKAPVALFLDSAGAKVSEGLAALGAFRRVFRAALDASLAGVPLAVLLGRNTYGGASMLAHAGASRLFSPETQLAMSGPSILAAAAGMSPMDDMFKAIAAAALTPESRAKANGANQLWKPGEDLAPWLREAFARPAEGVAGWHREHAARGERLPKGATRPPASEFRRKELERLFPEGCEMRESEGLVTGIGKRGGHSEALIGLVSRKPVDADRAWRFADHAWHLLAKRPARVHVVLDCESHAAKLDDEKIVLSEYIVGMSHALEALRASGSQVELTILDRAGGGVYVALAAPATHVGVLYGANVQVLPGAAIAAILGESKEAEPDKDTLGKEAVSTGVADAVVKLGIVEAL